jgi:hypothetical protein
LNLAHFYACYVTAAVVQIYSAEANLRQLDNFTFQQGKDALEAAATALKTRGAHAGAAVAAASSAGPMDVDAGCALGQVGAGVLRTLVASHLCSTRPFLCTMTSTVLPAPFCVIGKRIAASAYLLHVLLLYYSAHT